jgi:hypothetical protein
MAVYREPVSYCLWMTVAFGVVLALSRVWLGFNVEPDPFTWPQAYKDAAHLFMGGLAGLLVV